MVFITFPFEWIETKVKRRALLAQVVLHVHAVIDLLLRADLLVNEDLAGEAGLLVGCLFLICARIAFLCLDGECGVDLGASGEAEGDEDVSDERLVGQFGGDAVGGGIELLHVWCCFLLLIDLGFSPRQFGRGRAVFVVVIGGSGAARKKDSPGCSLATSRPVRPSGLPSYRHRHRCHRHRHRRVEWRVEGRRAVLAGCPETPGRLWHRR